MKHLLAALARLAAERPELDLERRLIERGGPALRVALLAQAAQRSRESEASEQAQPEPDDERAYAHPHPSLDLERYTLQRGRYHLRPELLSQTAQHLGYSPEDERARAAIEHVTHSELLPALRVGIYAPRRLTGHYIPATEGSVSGWAELAGVEGADTIAAQRQKWEAAHGLIRDGKHPVSGSAIVLNPPGAEGHGLTWLDGYGQDQAREYGSTVHLLKPDALARTLFVLGDAHNAAEMGHLPERALTHAEAALLASTFGALPFLEGTHGESPYIEGLTLGGVDLERDLDAAHSYTRGKLKLGERAESAHVDHLARRVEARLRGS